MSCRPWMAANRGLVRGSSVGTEQSSPDIPDRANGEGEASCRMFSVWYLQMTVSTHLFHHTLFIIILLS